MVEPLDELEADALGLLMAKTTGGKTEGKIGAAKVTELTEWLAELELAEDEDEDEDED